jgi:hypothetical protein
MNKIPSIVSVILYSFFGCLTIEGMESTHPH